MKQRDYNLALPGRIRTGMDVRGIYTQAELARKAGISHCTLSAILGLRSTPNRETLERIAQALHVSPEWLTGNQPLTNFNGPTLCWTCQRAVPGDKTDGCSWSRSLTPVDGWEACESIKGTMKTWHVVSCPEYIQDEEDE